MYHCDICGREIHKKIRMGGYTLCSKHMHQLQKYGRFFDSNPRTNKDLNDYKIKGKDVYFRIYNQKNEYVTDFVVDFEDIEKVKYHKWRLSHNHVVTGQPAKRMQRDLSHIVLGIPKDQDSTVVDHIDGNPLNNRKENLRICTQSENVRNKAFVSTNTSGFIGVTYNKSRNRFEPEIRVGYNRCHLGRYRTLQEAVYARYVAEEICFGEYVNEREHQRKMFFCQSITVSRKNEIETYVSEKLLRKNLGNQLCRSA